MTIRRLPLLAMALAFLLAACGSDSPAPAATTPSQGDPAPSAAVSGLVPVTLAVPEGMDAAPLNTQRQALVPPGWTLSVFARVPSARQAAWAPDGTLLVSVPENGTVVRLEPDGRGTATVSALLTGLNQPHGLAFSGSALYVAQSDRVDAFAYAAGQATDPRPVVTDLPDARSPDLRGRYAHALKSVAVGQDGSVYVSVGSTGNISADDLTATPPRASILRVPPGGGPPEPFAVGVRNGTALAVAPDGAVWTAVNNRDNIQFPYDRPYGDDPGSARGQVIDEYVRDHPVEPFAKLTPGRNLGWPYCNPDADVDPGVRGSRQDFSDVPFTRDVQTNPDGRMLDCATLPPWSRHSPGIPRRWACRSSTATCQATTPPARWWAYTARGTRHPHAPRKCRSSPGATATWAGSRPWSAGSRLRTALGGAVRWPRSRDRTGPSTSPTTRPTPCTGWLPRRAEPAAASSTRPGRNGSRRWPDSP